MEFSAGTHHRHRPINFHWYANWQEDSEANKVANEIAQTPEKYLLSREQLYAAEGGTGGSAGAAWAQRFRDTLHMLWHGTDPSNTSRAMASPDPAALVLGFRSESDEQLAALHFATGLFLGYEPADCAGYVDRMFRLGTYKHANGTFRLYPPARRRALAESAARIARDIVAPRSSEGAGMCAIDKHGAGHSRLLRRLRAATPPET